MNSYGKVQNKTVPKFYDVMMTPVLLYGCECWSLTKQEINRREIAEMSF